MELESNKSRERLGTAVQWITGFCNLMRHRHKKNPELSDKCRLCKTQAETPEHISFHCPRLIPWRTDSFKTYCTTPESWSVPELVRFLRTAPIADLLVDETEYPTRHVN